MYQSETGSICRAKTAVTTTADTTMTTHPESPSDDAIADLLRSAWRDEPPPAAVRARAVALHDPMSRLAGRASAMLRRLVAAAVPDVASSPFAPAFGVRGAAHAGRQWLFKAEECEIDLRAAPRGERWVLAGQLFGASQAERVVLGGAVQASAEVGPTREFSFTDLPAGRYSLSVQGGDLEVVIPQFDVGEAPQA
jgi:hypothetical protein